MIIEFVLVVTVATGLLIRSVRRRPRAGRDPLALVFGPHELRAFDAYLDEIAVAELGRIDADVVRYVAGEAGHIVVVSDRIHDGIELGLSDGHRLALGVVSASTRKQLQHRATNDKLRPAGIERKAFSYLLLLRGETGAELEIHARRVVLTP